ncbi:MAG: 2TM domain-containing protein [Myxococcales bacterium FL481]|nr:MAG: 2TM domain-containing protein [Myxococcales bacterium FL481]
MSEQSSYERAKVKVQARLGFYTHLAVYLAVNTLLIVINLSSDVQELWFKWPLLGWGIGVVFHALGVFYFVGRRPLAEKMIEREMHRQTATPPSP